MIQRFNDTFPLIEVLDSVDITFEGKKYSAQWSLFWRKEDLGKPCRFPPLLTLVDEEGNDLESVHRPADREIKLLAIQHRLNQIHDEIGYAPITDLAEVQKILDRVWSGEWMGQFEFGGNIHRDTLRQVLNLELDQFWPLLDTIIEKKMVGTIDGSWFLYNPQDN
ncbi:MAG: hypothetical protein H9W81_13615 [Enterococcus sp.]|nr:hypothetical protein [Enterococcus sp.]